MGFCEATLVFLTALVSVRLRGRCIEDVRGKEELCVCAQVCMCVCAYACVYICVCVLIVWLRKRGETCYLHG